MSDRDQRLAIVFPGQGSQAVGMGRDLYEQHEIFRSTYDEATEVLGYDISRVSFEGPTDELSRTDVTQAALLVNSIATLRLLEENGLVFGVALGHSLGEYTALVATGAVSFREAVDLVRLRGQAMLAAGEARPGAMAAVLGLEADAVAEICAGMAGAWPANYNSPGQVVVSGTLAAVSELEERAAAAGARRVVRLPVSGAFHSPLMASAAETMRGPLAATAWRPPHPPFFSVCSVSFESGDFVALLERQLTAPVRFEQAIRRLWEEGYTSFLELGAGTVLAGLIRRIAPDAEAASVGDAATVAAVVSRARLHSDEGA